MEKILLIYLIVINTLTFIVMLYDKLQASYHSQRVRERTLYTLTLIGGSPAMVVSMYTIRHKSRKLTFQCVVWFLFLLQLAVAVFVFVPAFVHLPPDS
jgi:uncharacterized membrane protein YsdA (DUF1294 family)